MKKKRLQTRTNGNCSYWGFSRTVGQQSKKKTNHVNLHVLINEHKQCNFQILSTQSIEHLKLKPIEL